MNKLLLITICWLLSANLLLSQAKRDKIDYKDLCFCHTFCLGDSVQKVKNVFIIQKTDTLIDEMDGEITTRYIYDNNTIFEDISNMGYITGFSTSNENFGLNLYKLQINSVVSISSLESLLPLSYHEMVEEFTYSNGNSVLHIDIINNPTYMQQVLVIYFENMRISSIAISTYY
jgi:hypothetical protein